jgi:hypothetical protein
MKRLALVGMLVSGLAPLAFGFNGANRLCWDPNVEADVAGYKLYLTLAGQPTVVKDILKAVATTSAPCAGGQVGVTLGSLTLPDGNYTGKVTAYDSNGNESVMSAEVIPSPFPLDSSPPVAPRNLGVK